MPIQVRAVLTLLAALSLVSVGWVLKGWKDGAAREASVREEKQQLMESIDLFRQKAQEAERIIAEYKAKQPTVTQIVKTIERPIYHIDCLDDDGLRMVETAANHSPGQSAGEVPGEPSGPEGQDGR